MNNKIRNFVGKDLPNENAYGKVTGSAKYTGDMKSMDMLYMKLKKSSIAHGMIEEIHIEEAMKIPGVIAVYSCKNTPDKKYDRGRVASYQQVPFQEKLFDDHVRFMGEKVAGVVAISEEIAEMACEKIEVVYKELKPAIKVEDAMKNEGPLIHEEGNVVASKEASHGDYSQCIAPHIHETESHLDRITHLSIETSAVRAKYDKGEDKLTVWTACQTVFGIRCTLADFLDIPYSKVRVVKALMGGSFGFRQETVIEPIVAYAAYQLGADIKLVFTREEQIINTMLKHNIDMKVESKVHEDGRIEGVKVESILDAGAYQTITPAYSRTIGGKLGKVYRMPNISYKTTSVCTNTPINGSFRSWGSSEANFAIENHWNHVAKELKIDPIEFRLKNIMEPYDLDAMYKVTIGNVLFKKCLETGREAFNWENRKKECQEKNKNSRRFKYGVGMALSSHTSSFYPYKANNGTAGVRLQEDGSLIVNICIHDHGCGTVLAMKKIAGEVFGMDIKKIDIKEGDTDINYYDIGCYASRTVYVLGETVRKCCVEVLEKATQMAANAFQCTRSLIHYKDGYFFKETDPKNKKSLSEISYYALSVFEEDIFAVVNHKPTESPGVAAAHFTEVEVDTFSGMVKILNCLSVHDIGKAINPDLCRGQVGSGIQQGMGMALNEWIKIDPNTGKTLITNFKNYEVANAVDMPDYEVIFIEEEEETGPFGAKSIGEVVVVPVPPAIVAAVNDALGTSLTKVPLTPPIILEGIEKLKDQSVDRVL